MEIYINIIEPMNFFFESVSQLLFEPTDICWTNMNIYLLFFVLNLTWTFLYNEQFLNPWILFPIHEIFCSRFQICPYFLTLEYCLRR
jgi:hypothetical protein